MKILKDLLTPKLKNAICITFISDIWTNSNQLDFLGLIAVCTDKLLNKEYLVIGMEVLNGMHKGENIAEAINSIVNNYEFDKSKINATVSDEGSNFVRLFKYQDSDLTFDFNETNDAFIANGFHYFFIIINYYFIIFNYYFNQNKFIQLFNSFFSLK